ncbi:MAG: DUF7948 domain-containing protein [Candidatus Hodarchaeales archaeon]
MKILFISISLCLLIIPNVLPWFVTQIDNDGEQHLNYTSSFPRLKKRSMYSDKCDYRFIQNSEEFCFTGFIQNTESNTDASIQFFCTIGSIDIGFGDSIIVFASDSAIFFISFPGSKNVSPVGINKKNSQSKYLNDEFQELGNLIKDEIWYYDLYPGVDLRYYFSNSGLKYDYIIHPGSDPNQISMKVSPSMFLSIREDSVSIQSITQPQIMQLQDMNLKVFQEDGTNIAARFIPKENEPFSYGFQIDQFDNSQTLIIDPLITAIPTDLTYELGSTGNNLSWNTSSTPFYNEVNYTIFRNDSEISTSGWIGGVFVTINVDGLDIGVFNYTIVFYETDGINITISDSNTVFVTVEDTTAPSISSAPANLIYTVNTIGHNLSWVATDNASDTYTVERDGSPVAGGAWGSGIPMVVDVDGLIIGTYNYTVVFTDSSGNANSTQTWVIVVDDLAPSISSAPANLTYTVNTIGHNLSWIATDNAPSNYTVERDGSPVAGGAWASGIPVVVDVDGLVIGTYNYTVVFTDNSGNATSNQTWVIVVDDLAPLISSAPANLTYTVNTIGHNLSWVVTDNAPNNYTVERDGSPVASGAWASGIPVVIDVDGLGIGSYNYTVVFTDSNGYITSSQIWVTVLDIFSLTITLTPADLTYELHTTGNVLSWVAVEGSFPSDNFIILRNSSIIVSSGWISGVPVTINVDGLNVGFYNFSIIFTDLSGNWVTNQVSVIVKEIHPPGILLSEIVRFIQLLLSNEIFIGLIVIGLVTIAITPIFKSINHHLSVVRHKYKNVVPHYSVRENKLHKKIINNEIYFNIRKSKLLDMAIVNSARKRGYD